MLKDHYLEGEERFGPFMSFLYAIGSALPFPRVIYKIARDDIMRTNPRSVLDVGCGPGDLLVMLSKAGCANLYGIDPSPDMIRAAKRKAHGRAIRFGIGSSREVPFGRKFGMIVSTLSFHHWAKRDEALRYLSRFLEGRGTIRIYELEHRGGIAAHMPWSTHTISEAALRRSARAAGLKVVSIGRRAGVIFAVISR